MIGRALRPLKSAAFQPAAKKTMPAEANSDGAGMGKPGICRANVANRGSHPAQNPQSGANASLEEQARGEQEARRLVAENMAIAGLGDEDLKKLPGSDSGNLAVARVAADHGRHAMAGRTFASAQRGKRQPANLWPPSPTPPGMRGCLERFFRRCVWLLGTIERLPRNGESSTQFERGFGEEV